MPGLFRGALTSGLALTLWGCSTLPSTQTQIVTRDVTAVCPISEPVFDRSFASEPPECVGSATTFRWADGKWIEALADSTGQIRTQSECMGLVADWIDDERAARNAFKITDNYSEGPEL